MWVGGTSTLWVVPSLGRRCWVVKECKHVTRNTPVSCLPQPLPFGTCLKVPALTSHNGGLGSQPANQTNYFPPKLLLAMAFITATENKYIGLELLILPPSLECWITECAGTSDFCGTGFRPRTFCMPDKHPANWAVARVFPLLLMQPCSMQPFESNFWNWALPVFGTHPCPFMN